jgi:hypothetical protein
MFIIIPVLFMLLPEIANPVLLLQEDESRPQVHIRASAVDPRVVKKADSKPKKPASKAAAETSAAPAREGAPPAAPVARAPSSASTSAPQVAVNDVPQRQQSSTDNTWGALALAGVLYIGKLLEDWLLL